MDREIIDTWLRTEAESIDVKIESINQKRKKLIDRDDRNSFDKINQYQIEMRELRASQMKLYEMIGRMDELEELYKEKNVETLPNQNQELLNALKKLWSVRTEPWTDEQRHLKFKTECEVEEVLNKYKE